jgi:hypothetical protein
MITRCGGTQTTCSLRDSVVRGQHPLRCGVAVPDPARPVDQANPQRQAIHGRLRRLDAILERGQAGLDRDSDRQVGTEGQHDLTLELAKFLVAGGAVSGHGAKDLAIVLHNIQ